MPQCRSLVAALLVAGLAVTALPHLALARDKFTLAISIYAGWMPAPTPWRRTRRPVWSGACQAAKLGGADKIVPLAEVAATVLTLVER